MQAFLTQCFQHIETIFGVLALICTFVMNLRSLKYVKNLLKEGGMKMINVTKIPCLFTLELPEPIAKNVTDGHISIADAIAIAMCCYGENAVHVATVPETHETKQVVTQNARAC